MHLSGRSAGAVGQIISPILFSEDGPSGISPRAGHAHADLAMQHASLLDHAPEGVCTGRILAITGAMEGAAQTDPALPLP